MFKYEKGRRVVMEVVYLEMRRMVAKDGRKIQTDDDKCNGGN